MEYQNDRMVLLSKVAHTRGLIDKADSKADVYLLALLDQQEAALAEFDAQVRSENTLRDNSIL